MWSEELMALQVKEVKSSESFKRDLDIGIAGKNTWSFTILVIMPLCLLSVSMILCSIWILLHLKRMGSALWESWCDLYGHKPSCNTATLYSLGAATTVLEPNWILVCGITVLYKLLLISMGSFPAYMDVQESTLQRHKKAKKMHSPPAWWEAESSGPNSSCQGHTRECFMELKCL